MPDCRALANGWVDAWNAHDLDRIMSHYADGVLFEAPTVVTRWNKPDGRLVGKEALRAHFARGLEVAPKLRITLEDVFLTPGGYAVLYRRENGNRAIDAVTLDEDSRASRVTAYYQAPQA